MRLSELGEKEIVDVVRGARYGELGDAELLFDGRSGKIRAVLVQEEGSGRGFFGYGEEFRQLPWASIRKIGEDIIIFDGSEE
ncbi:MAG: YlmC/YmxH family sporulation protein [Firmicutes bacterium]|nr:YlmC/YmxH family sporulation protein [Clostridiales bacterium]MBQ9931030.1 YlmC/YmxH family sporulation protein [Bacillota bacterium]